MGARNASERGGKISPRKQLFASNAPMSCFSFRKPAAFISRLNETQNAPEASVIAPTTVKWNLKGSLHSFIYFLHRYKKRLNRVS